MGYVIDEEKLNSPNMKVMDINNPPIKQVPYQPFPKMVYLHPKDKTKEARTLIVNDQRELDEALKKGWRKEGHVPTAPEVNLSDDFEADVPEKVKK